MNGCLPAASMSRLSFSKLASGKYTSPRTSNSSGRPAAGSMASGTLRAGRAAHALGGRIGGDEVGVLLLELGQLAVERVVLSVRQLGLVEHVVEVLVPANLPAELLQASGDVRGHSLVRGAIVPFR